MPVYTLSWYERSVSEDGTPAYERKSVTQRTYPNAPDDAYFPMLETAADPEPKPLKPLPPAFHPRPAVAPKQRAHRLGTRP
jgi:hypothetical protein